MSNDLIKVELRRLRARADMLLRQWRVVWSANLIVITVCGVALWPVHPGWSVPAWCATNFLLFILRLCKLRRFRGHLVQSEAQLRDWLFEYAAYAFVGGIVWGTGVFAFMDAVNPELMVFMLVLVLTIASGALPSLSSHFPAYACFSIPLIGLVAVKLWMLNAPYSLALSALSLVYLLVCLMISRNLSRSITAAINVDLENERLLEEVLLGKEEAERANAAKSQFLAAASHDVRQPLHAAGFFLDALGQRLDHHQQKELFGKVRGSLDALEDMFGSLLEISRLDAGVVTPAISDFPLAPLLDGVVSEFSPDAHEKGLLIETAPCDWVVCSDPVLLSNVLRNLVSNAIKYTDSGSVRINALRHGAQITVQIEDTGCGIEVDKYDQIFTPYYQLGNPERNRDKGFGLGLAVVDLTVRLLGHSIRLESAPGVGSMFEVTLERGDPARVTRITEPTRRRDLTGIHVVVIDDEPGILSGMRTLLGDWGCKVTIAESASEALEALRAVAQPPDLLICDYRLRDGANGIDAVALLRSKIDPELPAMLVSGDTDPALLARSEALCLHLLHKPAKPSHLMKVIADLV